MSDPQLEAIVPLEPVRLGPGRMQGTNRWALVVLALLLAGVLGLARWLRPDERGYGTHEQMGLPPCAFRVLTGVPCPSCGMTTSFAYTVRGQLLAALLANPGGCLLAVGSAGLVPWCLASAAVGRTIGIRSPERATIVAVLLVFGMSIVAWAIRFFFFGEQG